MACCLFDRKTNVKTVIGVGGSIMAVVVLKSLLYKEPQHLGIVAQPHVMYFLLNTAIAHACLYPMYRTNADYIINVLILVRYVNGISFSIFPDRAAKAYGIPPTDAAGFLLL